MSMWKRNDGLDATPEDSPHNPAAPAPSARPSVQHSAAPASRSAAVGRAVIGPSIRIQGDLSGEEDLLVEGRVDGKIDLKKHSVTIGENGRVKADVYARSISVEGEVKGNLVASEQITVRQSGHVLGNITAPRVSLEDGAQFKGSIDMEHKRDGAEKGRGDDRKGSDRQRGDQQSGGKSAGAPSGGGKGSPGSSGPSASAATAQSKTASKAATGAG